MGESEIISILSNSEIFNLTSILKTLIRGIGWGIINLLAFISNGIETVVNEIYSLNGFFSSQQLNDFIDEILPLAWVILALSIVFLGYKLIFDREFRVNNVFKNIIYSRIYVTSNVYEPYGKNDNDRSIGFKVGI